MGRLKVRVLMEKLLIEFRKLYPNRNHPIFKEYFKLHETTNKTKPKVVNNEYSKYSKERKYN